MTGQLPAQVTASRRLAVRGRSMVGQEQLPNRAQRPLATSVLLIGLLAAGCGWGGDDSSGPGRQASTATAAPATPGPATTASVGADTPEATAAVVARFIQAANRGDVGALGTLFAADARFDRAGTIFMGREEIIDRFLEPEVADAGGRYRETGRRREGDRLVVGFIFDTGGGGQERFTYSFLVRNGQIADVIGRYTN
jgi:SnoaL-like domain